MVRIHRHLKRIGIDATGYLLIILGLALGWLPGPGGIPLVLVGLALLSIHNPWAAKVRDYILRHSGRFLTVIFPLNPVIQWLYDLLGIGLLATSALLLTKHHALWQVSLGTFSFFLSLLIFAYNRGRFPKKRK